MFVNELINRYSLIFISPRLQGVMKNSQGSYLKGNEYTNEDYFYDTQEKASPREIGLAKEVVPSIAMQIFFVLSFKQPDVNQAAQ
ncbi:hypothetical protein [Serratia quinivorans]|uniref:hypothetical protein n=1 Tax=Serratia quinivorans TaxID=137545 RepID=UPI003F982255